MEMEYTRLTINYPTVLVKRIDEYAQTLGLKRTSAVVVLLNNALDSLGAVATMKQLLQAYEAQQLLESGEGPQAELPSACATGAAPEPARPPFPV